MKISVVIPSYNRELLLTEAIDSVLAQTYSDFELIVVDDGSDDGSADMLCELKTLRCLAVSHTGRAGAARNRGVEAAEGEWVAFLDSDDLWMPEKLHEQAALVQYMENSSIPCVLVHTRERWERSGRTVSQRKQRHRRDGDIFADCLRKCIIGPSTAMIRRDIFLEIGGFSETLEIAEDYELWLRLTDRYPAAYIDHPLTVKREGDWSQLSHKYDGIEIFRIQALESLLDSWNWSCPEHCLMAARELARKYAIHMQGCLKRGKEDEARVFDQRRTRLLRKFRLY